MAFKQPTIKTTVPKSPDRLFRDLPRRKHASLFDHQGQILRTYADQGLEVPDVAFQLPTGSGKTLVGLLLAEWRRRKFAERVLYLCPTRQLVRQVSDEASSKYGLAVESFIGRAADYSPTARAAYENADRLAVATYSSLFNTNPFFSDPQIVILDDSHTSDNYIASLWTVHANRSNEDHEVLFRAIVGVLKSVVSNATYERLITTSNPITDIGWVDKIPTPRLAGVSQELRLVIDENISATEQRYPWQMIRDHLNACQVYVSSSDILIRPLIPPTWQHRPFTGAKQRIFMSATLGSGGDLERLTGRAKILRLSIPEGWDRQGIGRRFFMFPEKSLREPEVLSLRRRLMESAGRSLVLVPSDRAAKPIVSDIRDSLGYKSYSGPDLEHHKAEFVKKEFGVAVIANRYDGIDLPDDDCRLLFIEGLPRTQNLQERFLMTRMGANTLFNERTQTRVFQAVGRCTRGLNDYSAVVVTGEDLAVYLTDRKRRTYFHPELQGELQFGIEQSTEVEMGTFVDNFEIFLEHEEEWEEANKSILQHREKSIQDDFPAITDLRSSVGSEINWQRAMWNYDYAEAFESAREVLGRLDHTDLRGYRTLWHYLAGSAAQIAVNHGDSELSSHARNQFEMARKASSGISWLVSLARGQKGPTTVAEVVEATVVLQVERLETYLQHLGTLHNRSFAARESEIRSGLKQGDSFEVAHTLLGEHLGFETGNREDDASPDPWWRVGDVTIVFEDHANAKATSTLGAKKARQAASHPNWVREHLPGSESGTIVAVLVTPVTIAKKGAMPHLKLVAYWELSEFRDWADTAIDTIRELRKTFSEPGDLEWRAEASAGLVAIRADAPGLSSWLSKRSARDLMTAVK